MVQNGWLQNCSLEYWGQKDTTTWSVVMLLWSHGLTFYCQDLNSSKWQNKCEESVQLSVWLAKVFGLTPMAQGTIDSGCLLLLLLQKLSHYNLKPLNIAAQCDLRSKLMTATKIHFLDSWWSLELPVASLRIWFGKSCCWWNKQMQDIGKLVPSVGPMCCVVFDKLVIRVFPSLQICVKLVLLYSSLPLALFPS